MRTTADDAFGHHRVTSATYDGATITNAAMQTTQVVFDPRFGTSRAQPLAEFFLYDEARAWS